MCVPRKLIAIVTLTLGLAVSGGVAGADGPAAGPMAKGDFARLVLAHLQAPASEGNVAVLVAWINAEGTTARWNPLATTLVTSASVGRHNSVGVQHYRDATGGAVASAATLARAFRSITAALRADSRTALWAAPGWSKYSGGSPGYGARIRSIYQNVVGRPEAIQAPLPNWPQGPPAAPAPVPAVPAPPAPAPVPAPAPAPVPQQAPAPTTAAATAAKPAAQNTSAIAAIDLDADKAAAVGLGVAIALLAAANIIAARRHLATAVLVTAGSAGIALITSTVTLTDAAAELAGLAGNVRDTAAGSGATAMRVGIGIVAAAALLAVGAARAGAGQAAKAAVKGLVAVGWDAAAAAVRLRRHVYLPAVWLGAVGAGYAADPRTVGWCLACVAVALAVGSVVQLRAGTGILSGDDIGRGGREARDAVG